MAQTHNLGFPRIGAGRKLKFALEKHWKGALGPEELEATALEIRRASLAEQAGLDHPPVGDFSLYDHVLDTSFLLGNVPTRARDGAASKLEAYWRAARGRGALERTGVRAGEMTKWFDTNYHYIVPEFWRDTEFALDASWLVSQIREARALGLRPKPVLVGPITYLWLGKSQDGFERLALLPQLLGTYRRLLGLLASEGVEWVQLDEPALVTELSPEFQRAYEVAYDALSDAGPKLLLTTYFGRLEGNLNLVLGLPVSGLHVDLELAHSDLGQIVERLPLQTVLSLGVVSGRNVWRSDLEKLCDKLEPLHARRGDKLWLAPSCSLLHLPLDLESETKLDPELKSWLAFAEQKLEEVRILGAALTQGRSSVRAELDRSRAARQSRTSSARVHRPEVRALVRELKPEDGARRSPYAVRAELQAEALQLPAFPTTTIGSFPQTAEIRRARSELKSGKLPEDAYRGAMRVEIERAVAEQERLGLDVLVHGEAERNDMVEYFGEQLEGFAITEFGWVQSYGSRCVKPPILYGDIVRARPMTLEWITYAQTLTEKPMKGMLTGPVTILNWSFVRDDQPRSATALQLSLAIRDEVRDLERAGIRIIQIDEAALREGLPLRRSEWAEYLKWAVDAFRFAANGVSDPTQIHTHMCYSEFNDIIEAIAAMDADVITIETSRSNMELLDAFERFAYPNAIGPGVYDIHSPNVPTEDDMVALLRRATRDIPSERLWVNPDCGLKTRTWDEVIPALRNMVRAAERLRASPVPAE